MSKKKSTKAAKKKSDKEEKDDDDEWERNVLERLNNMHVSPPPVNEWWFPNPTCCDACGKKADEDNNVKLKRCSSCKAVRFCSVECQKKSHPVHKEHCPILKYLEHDKELLLANMNGPDDNFKPIGALIELTRLLHPAYKIRVEGNKHFAKRQWSESAQNYEKAIQIMKDTMEKAKMILRAVGCKGMSIEFARVLWEGNESRMVSNLIWCYLKHPDELVESVGTATAGKTKSSVNWTDVLRTAPPTDGGRIIQLIKSPDSERMMEFQKKSFRKAEEALDRAPAYSANWWKMNYRAAQVAQCLAEPQEAMKKIEKARRLTGERDVFYDPEKEQESALHQIKLLEEEVEQVLMVVDRDYLTREKQQDGKPQGLLANYMQLGLTPLRPIDHPRVPIATMKEEILAVRLLAATELAEPIRREYADGTPVRPNEANALHPREEATALLNEILSTVAQPPLNLFPATGSGERVPPISAHLLAFYFRACLTDKAMKKFGIEEFCERTTGDWLSDEKAYALATHAFEEVENAHSPSRGHAKTLTQTGNGGCMPCSFRLLRSGHSMWADGLQQAVHHGQIEWTAFCLNRLLCGIDGKTVVDTILEVDGHGCNAMMHAANDNFTGFTALSTRLLVHAVSFSVPDFDAKPKAIRRILNTCDQSGFTPAMACVTLGNTAGLSAFVDLGARLWDKSVNNYLSDTQVSLLQQTVRRYGSGGDENMRNMIAALQSRSNELDPCSYCGKPPKRARDKLLYCSRCNRSRYCSKECQRKAYKKHKFVCTTAKVEEDSDWYASNVSAPKP